MYEHGIGEYKLKEGITPDIWSFLSFHDKDEVDCLPISILRVTHNRQDLHYLDVQVVMDPTESPITITYPIIIFARLYEEVTNEISI